MPVRATCRRHTGTRSGKIAVSTDNGTNITSGVDLGLAIYACDRKYYWALANVTVNAEDEKILSIEQPVSQQLLTETQFSDADFEAYLDSGTLRSTNLSALNTSNPELRAISYHENVAGVVINNLILDPTSPLLQSRCLRTKSWVATSNLDTD